MFKRLIRRILELFEDLADWIRRKRYMYLNPNWKIENANIDEGEVDVRITSGEFTNALLRFSSIQVQEDTPSVTYNFEVRENGDEHGDMNEWELTPNAPEGSARYRLVVASQNIMDGLLQHAVQQAEAEEQRTE